MIGSNKKWGTDGHIEHDKSFLPYYKSTNGKDCVYKNNDGKCTLRGYINSGMYCKRPATCHKYQLPFEPI